MTNTHFLQQVVSRLQKHKSSFTEKYVENFSCLFLPAVAQQLLSKIYSFNLDVRSSALDLISPRSSSNQPGSVILSIFKGCQRAFRSDFASMLYLPWSI